MTHPALARILGHARPQPDVVTPPPDDSPGQREFFENSATPPCTCPALDGHAQNPTCPAHPWWKRDPAVLELADRIAASMTPWEAAAKTFGGGS